MARILKILQNSQKIRAHKLNKGVECEYQVIEDGAGDTLLHLSTFGSQQRISNRKSSQSLQIDRTIARDLIEVFGDTFGFETVDKEESQRIAAYRKFPELFRHLIADDISARDVIALAHRKSQVEKFRRLLVDDDFFEEESEAIPGEGAERVWQKFFEDNPWIFGASLTGQFLTSWDAGKLEKIVTGSSVSQVGKRADALLRTSGRIKSTVFAEIKTHKKDIIGKKIPFWLLGSFGGAHWRCGAGPGNCACCRKAVRRLPSGQGRGW
nr:Shedu anti-phage system protein SduA domain-containing protein [Nocardia wallacei]